MQTAKELPVYIRYAFIHNDSLSCLPKAILGEFKVISNCAKNYSFEIRQASLEETKDIIIYFKNKFHQPFFITMGHFEFAFES